MFQNEKDCFSWPSKSSKFWEEEIGLLMTSPLCLLWVKLIRKLRCKFVDLAHKFGMFVAISKMIEKVKKNILLFRFKVKAQLVEIESVSHVNLFSTQLYQNVETSLTWIVVFLFLTAKFRHRVTQKLELNNIIQPCVFMKLKPII